MHGHSDLTVNILPKKQNRVEWIVNFTGKILPKKKKNYVFIWFYLLERGKDSKPMEQILSKKILYEQHSWILTKFFL